MRGTSQNRLARLHALGAVIALMLGFLSAQISLVSNSPDVCSMACCVKEGHCCCNPRRASVEGQAPDGKPTWAETEVVSPCPEGCANSTASFSLGTKEALRPANRLADFSRPVVCDLRPTFIAPLYVNVSSSPPRAPPFLGILPA
jgi:hypothetical protein